MAIKNAKADYILAFFDDEEPVLEAAEEIQKSGVKIHEVYSPFPIHGIDPILGYKRSRLPIAAFLFGCVGFSAGLGMQAWMLGVDWPMNIGGKPALAWPDFVPVTFELTVLVTALGMVGTYFYACGMFPGIEPKSPDLRITSDRFCIAFRKDQNDGKADEIKSAMMHHGAIELREEEILL